MQGRRLRRSRPAAPSSPNHPARERRNPVITSSQMSSAPARRVSRAAAPPRTRAAAGRRPCCRRPASVITPATRSPCAAKRPPARAVVEGQHEGLRGAPAGDAGGVGHAERGDAGPGGGQERVDVAVVAAGELHHQRPAGEAAGQADRAHRRLGAELDQADLLRAAAPASTSSSASCTSRSLGVPKLKPFAGGLADRRRGPPGGCGRGSSAPRSRPGRASGRRRRRSATGPARGR